MTKLFEAGAEYGEWRPSGERAWSFASGAVFTHQGPLTLPPGVKRLLFTRIPKVGPFQIAGKDHNVGEAWQWDGTTWTPRGLANGTSAFIFDFTGTLRVILPGPNVTSQGYRDVVADGTPAGRLIFGDDTYGPFHGLNEYTDLGDGLVIGQGNPDNDRNVPAGAIVWDGSRHRLLHLGLAYFIHANRVGSHVAISFSTPTGVWFYLLTMSELRTLPLIETTVPLPPKPPTSPIDFPPPFTEPPVSDFPTESFLQNRRDVVDAVNRDYPGLIRNDSGAFVDQVCHRLNKADGTDRFGRKLKNDGRTLNDDVVTYRLSGPSDKHMIDIIAGDARVPVWNLIPLNEEAGNGTWVKPQSPDRDGGTPAPVPAPPSPPTPVPADPRYTVLLAELNALKQRVLDLEQKPEPVVPPTPTFVLPKLQAKGYIRIPFGGSIPLTLPVEVVP